MYLPNLAEQLLIVSFMTVAELDRWALQKNWGEARQGRMAEHLRSFVVHPVNRALCRKWAEVSDTARRNGRPIQAADAWIAATALLHNIPLVTHNADDYTGVTGLTVISHSA